MTESITPPPELVQQWASTQAFDIAPAWMLNDVATRAAQWGADQELEACCEWLESNDYNVVPRELRAARRPKPPSLKQQAMERCSDYIDPDGIIRRALEALSDD